MMRLLLYLLAAALLSCARGAAFTSMPATYQQATTPAADAPLVVMPKKNSGTITLQLGAGNVATQTQAPRAAGPVVAGQGHTVTAPPADERWPPWRWAFVGAAVALVLRQLVPWAWRRWAPQLLPRPR